MPSLRRHVVRQINEFRETDPAQRRFRGRVWYAGGAGGDDAADRCEVHTPGVDGIGCGKLVKGCAFGCETGKKAVGGGVVPPPAK